MKTTINIKSIGKRYGTVGWLKQQFEEGNIILEESNNFYIPWWSNGCIPYTQTHGLVMRDKEDKHSVLIAYRNMDGEYKYAVQKAIKDTEFSHWTLALTDAAIEVLEAICDKWIDMQPDDSPEENTEITVKILR